MFDRSDGQFRRHSPLRWRIAMHVPACIDLPMPETDLGFDAKNANLPDLTAVKLRDKSTLCHNTQLRRLFERLGG